MARTAAEDKSLLLLDMNGTICYRSEMAIRRAKHQRAKHDLYVRRKYYYARRGIRDFVTTLARSGSFTVCVYTSMMAHNAHAGVEAILPCAGIDQVFDRGMNEPDPFAANDWDTVRDMDKIWEAMPGYGPERTLLLDNEARKFQDAPRNGIVVPEYGAAEVRRVSHGRRAETLPQIKDYLLRLAAAALADVRDYLEANPIHGADEGILSLPDGFDSLTIGGPQALCSNTSKPVYAAAVPRGTSLHFVCAEDGTFTMSNMQAGITVKGQQLPAMRIEPKMDFHMLQTLVGEDKLLVEIDAVQFKKWRAGHSSAATPFASAPSAAPGAAADKSPAAEG
jgi:hypothetical protein